MNETKNETVDSEITKVEDVVIEDGDDVETIKEKYAQREALLTENNAKLYARTKKAEGFEFKDGKWVKPEAKEAKIEPKAPISQEKLSTTDLLAIVKADVPEEDIEIVTEYATMAKISIKEALAKPLVKSMLAEKAEQRSTAEATNTNTARRGNSKVSDTELLSNANKGIMPESEEDIKRLIAIRRAKR